MEGRKKWLKVKMRRKVTSVSYWSLMTCTIILRKTNVFRHKLFNVIFEKEM